MLAIIEGERRAENLCGEPHLRSEPNAGHHRDEMAARLTENASHLTREIGHELGDHHFRLVERAQLLPVDRDRNVMRDTTKP